MLLRLFSARDGQVELPPDWEPVGFVAGGVWCRWVGVGRPEGV